MEHDRIAAFLNRVKLLFQIAVLGAALYVILNGQHQRIETANSIANLLSLTQEIRQEVASPYTVRISE